MNETKRRINEYKGRLPKLKERVIAVTLLLAISLSMLTTVTFAWVALSTSPEVTGVNTSITSNGNLEIALALGEDSPFDSKVGDGNLPDLERNNTWGNLINLADAEYGLDNLVLRPALLNDDDLIGRPLHGPVYDEKGRVVDMNTNFGYAKWDSFMSRFTSTTDELFENAPFGVRAITSMDYGTSEDNADVVVYNQKLDTIGGKNIKVQDAFQAIADVQAHKDALQSLMTGYMIENRLKNDPTVGDMVSDANLKRADLQNCVYMYEALIKCFEDEAIVVADLLNLQSEVRSQAAVKNGTPGTFPTTSASEILAFSENIRNDDFSAKSTLEEKGFIVSENGLIANLDQFLTDYNTLVSDLERIKGLITWFGNSTSKPWKNTPVVDENAEVKLLLIDAIVNNLVTVDGCTIVDEKDGKERTIGNITAGDGIALNGAECMTNINNGILYNFHSFCGGGIETGSYLNLQVTVVITATIKSKVRTVSPENYYDNERAAVKEIVIKEFGEPPYVAKDTYGFAIDLWVRTNAPNTFLTLQGNVLTETRQEAVKGKDSQGNEVDIYTITVQYESEGTGEESNALGDLGVALTQSFDVYQIDDKWYFADNHNEVTAESLGLAAGSTIPNPIQKIENVEYVVGYEGENRIWNGDEHYMLSVDSSTQGSGSCYVFYAETPVDQEQSLNILKSMKVAFVDDKGNLLATASMDSDRHYAESGKVIVPLVLDADSENIGTDVNGEPMYAITALEQNVATRITAIVYLDGTNLSDDDVLASADIQGKINIQFGSSAALYPLMNEELYVAELVASVDEVNPTEFDYDSLADGAKMETNVKVRIEGSQPSTVTANFIRRINATQGSPEKTFTLNDEDKDGVWEGSYEFLYPGTYILRSVYLDGVERDLKLSNPGEFPTVTVAGHTITSVSVLDKNYVMTDANTYSDDITISFASDDPDKMPKSVVGKFIREGSGVVNVNFVYDPTTASWKGNANFVSSGKYTMQYLVLDGQYLELAEGFWREIELILGMRVNVKTISVTDFGTKDEDIPSTLQMQVEIVDNNGDIIPSLANASLTYKLDGGYDNLYTSLTWDSVNKYYEGEFNPAVGVWKFNNVTVRIGEVTNVLTIANSDAPVFTIIPPEPPAYIESYGVEDQFIIGDSPATVSVTMSDATAATLYAKFTKLSAEGTVEKIEYIPHSNKASSDDGENYFYFNINETGIWRLDAVSAFNVYDETEKLYSIPEGGVVDETSFNTGYIFDANTTSDEDVVFEPRTVYVLHSDDVKVSVEYADGVFPYTTTVNNETIGHLGKDANGNITADFMASHTIGANTVTLKFRDEYKLIESGRFTVDSATFEYSYDSFDIKYGGYNRSDEKVNAPIEFSVAALTFGTADKGVVTNYVDGSNVTTFQYAAKYSPSVVTFSINGIESPEPIKEPSNAYAIEVWSNKPEVKITAVTPTGTYNVDTKASGSVSDTVNKVFSHTATKCGEEVTYYDFHCETSTLHQKGYVSSISEDRKEATVYFKCDHNEAEGEYKVVEDQEEDPRAPATPHQYEYENGNGVPSVTLTLSNTGNLFSVSGSSAQLNFVPKSGTAVRMYSKYTSESKFSLTNFRTFTFYRTEDADLTSSYSWTGENGCTRFVGYMKQTDGGTDPDRDSSDSKTAAGTIMGSELVVTYKGATYHFTIDTITINNPH